METLDDLEKIINDNENKNWLDRKFPAIFGYYFSYAIAHPFFILKLCLDEINFAWQRIFKKYDERVSWSLDSYLAEMIPKWISDLRHAKVPGIPMSIFEKYPLDENYEISDKDEKKALEEWHSILIEIENGFKDYTKMAELNFHDPEIKNMEKRFERAFELFHQYWSDLWW
jgi:hypothetical protein